MLTKKKIKKKLLNSKNNLRVYKPLRLDRALIGSMDWIWLRLKIKNKYKT